MRKEKSEGVVIGGEDHKNYIDMEEYMKLKREKEELEKSRKITENIIYNNLKPRGWRTRFIGRLLIKLLYFIIERMTKIDENIQTAQNMLSGIVERCYELEEENKNLNEKLSEITMVADDEKQSIEHILELEEENKKLREDLEETENDLEHRDSFFSIMRDVLANETITNNEIAMIVYCVVHEECGDYDLSEKELEVVKKFRDRDYV